MNKVTKCLSLIFSMIIVISACIAPVSAFAQDQIKGVDVSEHNSNVDFVSLKNQGYDFAMIRLGYSDKYLDKNFYQNVQNAVGAGMRFGVYLYSYAYNTAEAQAEANFVISTLASLDASYKQYMVLPVAYDLEDKKILEEGKCGKTEITNMALTFCNAVKAAGYDTMVYANDNWFKNYIDTDQLVANNIKIWYAYWTNSESNPYTYIKNTAVPVYMWQYQSGSYNTVNGLDQNLLFYSTADIPAAAPAPIAASGFRVRLSKTKFTYDGKTKKPTVAVYDSSDKRLSSAYYTVNYVGNANPGKKKLIIIFKNGYTGKIVKYYNIIPKKQTVSSINSSSKKKLKVTWKKDKTVSGYQVQYSTSKKFYKTKSKAVLVSKKNTSKTISNLKSGKKYYVRVRAYKTVDGKRVYGSWSSVKTVKVK